MAIIGGLNDELDIKILVLYILGYAGVPLGRTNLTDIAMDTGTVEYFDLSQAIDDLLMTGHIDIISSDEPDTLRITQMGKHTLTMFENNLPYTVRRKNQASLVNMLAKIERKRQVKTNTVKKAQGYEVTCTLLEGEDKLLEYTVFVPMQIQAQMIADRFETHTTDVYQDMLALLIDEKIFEDK